MSRHWSRSTSNLCRSKKSAPIMGCVTLALMTCQVRGRGSPKLTVSCLEPYVLMVELFAARKVRSVLCKRSVLVAGKTLISEPVSTRKYCLMFESKSLSKWDLPVEWAAFTDWLAGFLIEICRVRGIWSLWS